MASPMAIQLSRSMAYYYFSFNMRLMVVQFLDNLEHQQWGQRIEEKVGGCNFRAGGQNNTIDMLKLFLQCLHVIWNLLHIWSRSFFLHQ